MEDDERQHLLSEIAKRDAEIAVLKQTIDALCRKIFGKSSEQLDPAQLELFDPPKKRPPPLPQTQDRRLKNHPASPRAASNRARRASPNTSPSSSKCLIRLK